MKSFFIFLILTQIETAKAEAFRCEHLFSDSTVTYFDSRVAYSVKSKIKGPQASWSGWIVVLSNEIKAFFKPVNKRLDNQRIKEAYQSPYHEVAAYKISEMLGIKIVPETIMTKLNVRSKNEIGSLQLYIEGKTAEQLWQEHGKLIPETDLVWLFDRIIANIDRSSGNYIFTSNGKIFAIDNSRSFFTHNSLERNFSDPTYGPAIREKIIRTFIENPQLLINLKLITRKKLKGALDQLLWPSQIEGVYRRIQTLIELMESVK